VLRRRAAAGVRPPRRLTSGLDALGGNLGGHSEPDPAGDPGAVPEDADDEPGWEVGGGIVSSAGNRTPISLALAILAGPMPLPRVLRPMPTTSGSMVHSGTGRACTAARDLRSRGEASEKT